MCIDSYINDDITPDDEDPAVALMGRQMVDIMSMAGVEIEDDGTVVYSDPPELEGESDNGDDEAEGDEAPFNPDDYIEGYSELSAMSKLKAVKELDIESDDDVAILEAIYDWENEQEKPSSRVLQLHGRDAGRRKRRSPEEDEPEVEEPEAEADEERASRGTAMTRRPLCRSRRCWRRQRRTRTSR